MKGSQVAKKKRNEILQMCLLNNDLSVLDETDSGLDIDALKSIAKSINQFSTPNKSLILITHYQRLLYYIIPDYVHIMQKGQIVCTGDAQLAQQLEKKGYNYFINQTLSTI